MLLYFFTVTNYLKKEVLNAKSFIRRFLYTFAAVKIQAPLNLVLWYYQLKIHTCQWYEHYDNSSSIIRYHF